MLIQDIMTRQVVAIGPDMPILDVFTLMEQRNIRHFPILEQAQGPTPQGAGEGELVGIVSDRDIRTVGSSHPAAPAGVSMASPVSSIMITTVFTAHPLDLIEETAGVMRKQKIGALPVLDGKELVGIVTSIDFLDALIAMTGLKQPGVRIEVEVADRPGGLAGLLGRIAEQDHNVTSVLPTGRDGDTASFALRVETDDGEKLAAGLRELGYEVLWPPEKLAVP
jgi:acetoin utilization protein AcuB